MLDAVPQGAVPAAAVTLDDLPADIQNAAPNTASRIASSYVPATSIDDPECYAIIMTFTFDDAVKSINTQFAHLTCAMCIHKYFTLPSPSLQARPVN